MSPQFSYDTPSFHWDSAEPLIQMEGIRKVFKTAAGEVDVLKGVSAHFYSGEFVSVVGRSGSGKSTLVNMITGIDHPNQGSVRVGKTLLHQMNEGKMSIWRGRHLGIVFQFFQLLPMLTLVENVMLPMDFCNLYPPAEREPRALKLLARVGLEHLAHKMPGAISGGQQQSVAIARALANDPPILIADEPTGNLDSRTAEDVMLLFEELVGQGKTILMVTHDSTLARRTGRSLVICDGEVIPSDIVQGFPDLTHPQLLRLSHLARRQVFSPNEAFPAGEDQVYLILAGEAEVLPASKTPRSLFGGSKAPVLRISSGQVFDPQEITRTHGSRAEIRRPAGMDLETLVFDRSALPTPTERRSA